MDALKLPLGFDTQRMLAELQALETKGSWHTHPDYTVAKAGDWTAIALIASESTDPNNPLSLRYLGGVGQPTPILASCPYLREVIDSFKTEVHRARLMNLRPGTRISPHRDYGRQRYSIERGFIRVHIPIRTHANVSFFINGRVIPMRVGEPWYTNVCQPHAVANESDVQRVHLVLDMKVNDWVLGLFPPLSPLVRLRGVILRRFERRYLAARTAVANAYRSARQFAGDMGLRAVAKRLRAG